MANIVGGALALLACATVCVVAGWTGGRASVELRQRIYVPKNIPKISNMVCPPHGRAAVSADPVSRSLQPGVGHGRPGAPDAPLRALTR
jgi:hypothetical protein